MNNVVCTNELITPADVLFFKRLLAIVASLLGFILFDSYT